jgi:hypothetical protein
LALLLPFLDRDGVDDLDVDGFTGMLFRIYTITSTSLVIASVLNLEQPTIDPDDASPGVIHSTVHKIICWLAAIDQAFDSIGDMV